METINAAAREGRAEAALHDHVTQRQQERRWFFIEYFLGILVFVGGMAISAYLSFKGNSIAQFQSVLSFGFSVTAFLVIDRIASAKKMHEVAEQVGELNALALRVEQKSDAATFLFNMTMNSDRIFVLRESQYLDYLINALKDSDYVQNFGFPFHKNASIDPAYRRWVEAIRDFVYAGGSTFDEIMIVLDGDDAGRGDVIDRQAVKSIFLSVGVPLAALPRGMPVLNYTVFRRKTGVETVVGWSVEPGINYDLPVCVLKGAQASAIFQNHYHGMKRYLETLDPSTIKPLGGGRPSNGST